MAKIVTAETFPDYVYRKIWNWSRWCWSGEWPHPLPPAACGSAERRAPSGPDWPDIDAEKREAPPAVDHDEARRVEAIYQKFSLKEQRIIQFKTTRRDEIDLARELSARLFAEKVCRHLGISMASYDMTLMRFRMAVMREFQ